jgi:hypothetical protein
MSAQLHRRDSVAFLSMGIPRVVPPVPAPARPRRGTVRFLHAPSRPDDKGTTLIQQAVSAVAAEGIDVELRTVTGRPNAEVLAAIADCDVVIDQLYSDTPMAALAAEAASLGRPAIVGGYGWDELRAASDADSLPPTHLCHPDDLAAAVRRLADDDDYRAELGRRARCFLEDRWAPDRVARRYLGLLVGDLPSEWTFDPVQITYVRGAGASEEAVRGAVRGVLEAAGPDGLQLDDKPHLVERLVLLASGTRGADA